MDNNQIPDNIAKLMVQAVQSAVGDDIHEDIAVNRLPTKNSVPSRIWDFINRNLIESLQTQECSVCRASRGPWEMLVVLEKSTRFIVTFMREKRFSDLVKSQNKRNKMHYLDMLTLYFNRNIPSPYSQLSIFPHEFSDEDRLDEQIQLLLKDLRGDSEIVRNHILVLFDTVGFELTSIRMVMLTPSLEIAAEENWSPYIFRQESVIVETIENTDSPSNTPNRGLKLKGRAIEKRKKNLKRKQDVDENEYNA